jgi:malonyl CoA-acyl carrier protein transacylase
LLQQFGEPIKQMVADMVEQLKEELDDGVLPVTELEESAQVITGHKRTIEEIDELLKRPGISEEEIDKLLDERNRLLPK